MRFDYYYSLIPQPLRDSSLQTTSVPAGRCTICREEISSDCPASTHCKCNKSFHCTCFDKWAASDSWENADPIDNAGVIPALEGLSIKTSLSSVVHSWDASLPHIAVKSAPKASTPVVSNPYNAMAARVVLPLPLARAHQAAPEPKVNASARKAPNRQEKAHLAPSMRPHFCRVPGCNKELCDKPTRDRHEGSHLPESEREHYYCRIPHCTKAFLYRNSRNKHEKVWHKQEGSDGQESDDPQIQSSDRQSKKKRKFTREHREALSAARRGVAHSQAHKDAVKIGIERSKRRRLAGLENTIDASHETAAIAMGGSEQRSPTS